MKAICTVLVVLFLAGCGPAPVPVTATPAVTLTPSPVPPTLTSTPTPEPTHTPAPSMMAAGSHMAFASNRDGNWEIYYMTLGEEPVRLTNSPDTEDLFPEFSPDGNILIYWSTSDASSYTGLNWMKLKDGSVTSSGKLVAGGGPEASFSPDGKHVAISMELMEDFADVAVGSREDKGFTTVTSPLYEDRHPAWSPDGKTIAFESDLNDWGRKHIYLMNPDGTDVRRLTDGDLYEVGPAWSPDGKSIAFTVRNGNGSNVYLVRADGTNVRNLTRETGTYNENPAWSPDGSLIAFFSDRTGNYEIFCIRADGTRLTNLTNNPAQDVDPSWSQ